MKHIGNILIFCLVSIKLRCFTGIKLLLTGLKILIYRILGSKEFFPPGGKKSSGKDLKKFYFLPQMNYQTWKEKTYNLSMKDFINELMENNFLKRSHECISCNCQCNLVKYTRNKDKLAWRCMNSSCDQYKKYISVRIGSFFEDYSTDIQLLFRVVIKYASGISRAILLQSFEGLETPIKRLFNP